MDDLVNLYIGILEDHNIKGGKDSDHNLKRSFFVLKIDCQRIKIYD